MIILHWILSATCLHTPIFPSFILIHGWDGLLVSWGFLIMGNTQSQCYLRTGVEPRVIVKQLVSVPRSKDWCLSPIKKLKDGRWAGASCDEKIKGQNCWGSKLHFHRWWGNMTNFFLWLRGKHWGIRTQIKEGCLPGWGNFSRMCVGGALPLQERKSQHEDACHTEGTNPKYQQHQLNTPPSLPLLLPLCLNSGGAISSKS